MSDDINKNLVDYFTKFQKEYKYENDDNEDNIYTLEDALKTSLQRASYENNFHISYFEENAPIKDFVVNACKHNVKVEFSRDGDNVNIRFDGKPADVFQVVDESFEDIENIDYW